MDKKIICLKMDVRRRIIRNIIEDNIFLKPKNIDDSLSSFLENQNLDKLTHRWVSLIQKEWNSLYPNAKLQINPHEIDENRIMEIVTMNTSLANSEEGTQQNTVIEEDKIQQKEQKTEKVFTEEQTIELRSISEAPAIVILNPPKMSIDKNVDLLSKKKSISNLPNARVKEEYKCAFKLNDDTGIELVKVLDGIPDGLKFTINKGLFYIHGIPTQAGDFVVVVECKDNKTNKTYKHHYSLIVVPDPRDLWKDIPPDKTAPYQKNNEDSKLIKEDGLCIVAASKRGRSHAHKGTFRDDDFFTDHIPSGWSILIVCDGAGSAKYSREGSKLAAKTAGEYLKSKLSHDVGSTLDNLIDEWKKNNGVENQLKLELRDLLGVSIQEAIKKIDEAVRNKENVTFKDYSTTFLLAICRKQEDGIFVASIGRGDGAIGVFDEEDNVMGKCMFVPDAGEFSGQTHFLDRALGNDWGAIQKRIYFHFFTGSPIIFLMTDGVSDPYFGAEANLEKYEYWQKLWLDVKPCLEMPDADKALLKWLDFFVAGEHDDRTIAILR